MTMVYNTGAAKKATNLSVNSDLLKKAKELKINLSATFEKALVDLIHEKQKAIWRESNRQAIEIYNRHVEKNGVFSSQLREF